MVLPMVIGALGTAPKGLEKRMEGLEIRGRIEIIITTDLLRSAEILRKVLDNSEDFLPFRLQATQ